MNFRDLKYFIALAEERHFGRAALRCHVSQPTLSGQIKKLEEALNIRLFERTNRRVRLTEVGAQIYPMAQDIINKIETIHETARSSRNPLAGTFRLGAFPTLSTYIFPQLAPFVAAEMPDLRLILVEEKTADLITQLKHGDLDAALLALPIQEDLLSHKLFDDTFYLAVPKAHKLAKCKHVTQQDVAAERLLLLEEGHCLRDQALEVCQKHGMAEEQDFKGTGLETLREMVKAGHGITLMPQSAMTGRHPGIVYLPFKSPAPKRTIGIVWRKASAKHAVVEKVITALKR